VCFFCGEPAVHLTYCAHHWQQHRTNIVEDHPELSWYVTIVKEIAHFFRIPASDILYLESQKDEHLHRRLVAVAVLRHLTNVSCEKLGILLSRNIANAIRAVKRANALYNTHPEFAADVDAVLRHLKYKGVW